MTRSRCSRLSSGSPLTFNESARFVNFARYTRGACIRKPSLTPRYQRSLSIPPLSRAFLSCQAPDTSMNLLRLLITSPEGGGVSMCAIGVAISHYLTIELSIVKIPLLVESDYLAESFGRDWRRRLPGVAGVRVNCRRPFRSQGFRVQARFRSGRSRLNGCAGCSRGSAPSFAPICAPRGIESAPVRLPQHGRAERRSFDYAACGIMQSVFRPAARRSEPEGTLEWSSPRRWAKNGLR
jgi:hypothetical protein